jgi:L-aminopeptidase/D-esterase-like protein
LALSGGSAFGLASATGVVRYLQENGFGLPVGSIRIPLVPAAVIYDYPANQSAGRRPDEAMGYQAAANASRAPVVSGPYGAGYSAASGQICGRALASPSGLGSAGLAGSSGLKVAVLVVVNPLGSVVNPQTGAIISGLKRSDGNSLADRSEILRALAQGTDPEVGRTVLVVVGTNAQLDKLGAYRLARMAGAGIARAIYPAHLLFDGDMVFALSSREGPQASISFLGALAAELVSQAIVNSVPGVPDLASPNLVGDF